jgi:TBC1 domain family member 10
MFAAQWFITLFAYSLPLSAVLRVWDAFLVEG